MELLPWRAAFLLTVLIEGALFLFAFGPSGGNARAVGLANLITHPIGYTLVVTGTLPFLGVEAWIVVAEALVYRSVRRLRWLDGIGASALCNGVTMLVSFWW